MRLRRLTAGVTSIALAVGMLTATMTPAHAAEPTVAVVDHGATRTDATGDIVLAWQRVPGATGYDVQVASDASFSTVVATASTSATRWVSPSGLWAAEPRQLFWRVAAKGVGADINGATVHSFARGAAPAPSLVSPADGTTITYPTPITLLWEVVPGATEYTVTYRLASGGAAKTAKVAGTAYALPALTDAGKYVWNVKAHFPAVGRQPAVEGPVSQTRTFTSTWGPASAPALLRPADGAVANDLEFGWSEVPGAKEYKFELSSDQSFAANSIVLTSVVSGTAFVPTNAMPLSTYHWRVTPLDVNGTPGVTSAARQVRKVSSTDATSETTSSAPATPQFIGLSTSSAAAPVLDFDSFQLRWTPVPRATYYRVEVGRSGGTLLTCTTASTSATIVALSTSTGNSKSALTSSGSCMWTSLVSDQIKPATADEIAANEEPVYIARVYAVNMSASVTKDYATSKHTDADVVPSSFESAPHYFRVRSTGVSTATPDAITPDSAEQLATMESSPYLTWPATDFPDQVGYHVNIYTDRELTSLVARLKVTTNSVRATGVFRPNRTTASDDSYWAHITPASGRPNAPGDWMEIVGDGVVPQTISWRRALPTTPAGTVSAESNVPVLRMAPNLPSQLGGAARGYAVKIYPEGGSNDTATLLVDQPATVAARAFSTSGTTFTSTALPTGRYEFTWAPLDAAGNETEHSPRTAFAIGDQAPTGLTAVTHTGATSATLSWSYPVSAKSYTLEVTPVGASTTVTATTTARAATVQGLTPGRAYTWRVRARDAADNLGAWATAPQTFTPVGVSGPAAVVDATGVASSAPVIAWAPVPGASRYQVKVYRAGQAIETVETAALSHVPTYKLEYGTAYSYDVQAVGAGPLSTAPMGTAQSGSLTVVSQPGAVAAPTTSVDGTSIRVTWNALVAPATGSSEVPTYTLQFRPKPAGVSDDGWTDAASGQNLTSHTLAGLAQATVYQFRVRASNSQGPGPWSPVRDQSTISQPGPVTGLTTTPGLGSLKVTWTAPAATATAGRATDYVVEYAAAGAAWSRVVVTSTTASLDGLSPGTAFSVRVGARNNAGMSEWTGLSAATLAAPGAPWGVKAKRGDRTATVTWGAPGDTGGSPVTGYTVEARQLTKSTWSAWSTRAVLGATATTYKATGLTNGVRYEFRVVAKTRLGTGAPSAAASVTPAAKPAAPTSVKATSTKKRTVKVTWKAAAANGSKVTGYTVQYSTNKGKTFKTLKSLKASARSYTWKKAASKKSYVFRVVAKNALGKSPVSAKASVTAR